MNGHAPEELVPEPREPMHDFFSVPVTLPDGRTVALTLPVDRFWPAFRVAVKLELDETLDLIGFAWTLLHAMLQHGITTPDSALAEIAALLADPLSLRRQPEAVEAQAAEAGLLRLSYKLLQERHWSSAQAAAFAAKQLGQPIGSDDWWTRVAQWATAQGLPPVT
jgi:hypothetical protein